MWFRQTRDSASPGDYKDDDDEEAAAAAEATDGINHPA